jgi:hypothetical protein
MKPFVNVDVAMPQDMLDALSILEAYCIGSNIKDVSTDFVKDFLSTRYSADLSSQFQQQYLFSSQEP